MKAGRNLEGAPHPLPNKTREKQEKKKKAKVVAAATLHMSCTLLLTFFVFFFPPPTFLPLCFLSPLSLPSSTPSHLNQAEAGVACAVSTHAGYWWLPRVHWILLSGSRYSVACPCMRTITDVACSPENVLPQPQPQPQPHARTHVKTLLVLMPSSSPAISQASPS